MVEPSRWEDGRSVIAGASTSGAYERRRTSIRRRVGLVVAVALVPVVLLVVLGVTGLRLPGSGRPAGRTYETAELVLVVVGVAVEAIGVVRMLRDKPGLVWNSPLTALTFGQRRELTRAVRRNVAVAPERQDLAVHLAGRLRRQRPMLLLVAGLTLSAVGRALSGRLLEIVVALVTVVLLAVGTVLILRDERLAGRWLASHEHARPRGSRGQRPPDQDRMLPSR